MFAERRRRETLASFDYQWRAIPEGLAVLSDPWFRENVDRIIADELVAVDRGWFAGRRVLDAGCGGGRFTLGLLNLGCRVLAVDFSASALDYTRKEMERWAPEAVAGGRLATERVDLLNLGPALSSERFDLVFSFGVLHHTGDTRRALQGLTPLVAAEGALFLYLYGPRSIRKRLPVEVVRALLSPLPFAAKRSLLKLLFPRRDPHQTFDVFSPTINDTHDFETIARWLRALGFSDVLRTIAHTELFVRATRGAALPVRELPSRPYWFERYRRAERHQDTET